MRSSLTDGWAISSHIALSTLMAFFPFLIVITSLAGLFGSADLADQATIMFMATWPKEVADPISGEIRDVLTTAHGGALTIGVRAQPDSWFCLEWCGEPAGRPRSRLQHG